MEPEWPDPQDDDFPWWRSFALSSLAWMVFAWINASQVFLSMLSHGHSYPRMVFFNLLVWGVWALLTPLVQLLGRRLPLVPFTLRALTLHLAAGLLAATLHTAAWTQLTIWIRPYDQMTIPSFDRNFAQLLWVQLQSEMLIYMTILGLSAAVDFARGLHRREVEAGRLEKQLAEAKLHSLELQLRPHFLFNTLNAISGLVRGQRNPEAVEMIVRLSDLLHQTLDTEHAKWIPLDRELALLRAYLEIEQVRFSDRLSLHFEVDAGALATRLPPFLLQPLAENALRHGIAKVAGPGRLEVHILRRGSRVEIEMTNSGPPLQRDRRGVGLTNSRERLHQLFGDEASLELDDVPGGVRARLVLPFREVEP